ncbi:hypothetical protein Gocc_0873 [Gaiella occulta]|uniref:Uncharacterized protein n=1 Tax=Gaiella occulta TaxID=1002870 RepID=A0A7M2YY46_9ACTN|nr:hypothetical protein [Gaiella occulta]RDI75075.1 hypothetical protein Gocc_0873 [Gaiella occulta]
MSRHEGHAVDASITLGSVAAGVPLPELELPVAVRRTPVVFVAPRAA